MFLLKSWKIKSKVTLRSGGIIIGTNLVLHITCSHTLTINATWSLCYEMSYETLIFIYHSGLQASATYQKFYMITAFTFIWYWRDCLLVFWLRFSFHFCISENPAGTKKITNSEPPCWWQMHSATAWDDGMDPFKTLTVTALYSP